MGESIETIIKRAADRTAWQVEPSDAGGYRVRSECDAVLADGLSFREAEALATGYNGAREDLARMIEGMA